MDNNKTVEFNAGISKSQEIRNILNSINFARLNQLAIDSELLTYNFEATYRRLISLYFEVQSKCSPEELKTLTEIKGICEQAFDLKYPVKIDNQGNKKINNDNLKYITKILELFEKKIRMSLDQHGFDTKEQKNSGEAMVN